MSHENSNDFSNVPTISSGQDQFWLPPVVNPFMELGPWWATQTVTDVPENIMGWLVAQGFEITNIRQDTTTKPPTNYFSVKKEGLRPQEVLRALCNSYTRAANEARGANQYRYNHILDGMNSMVDSSNTQFAAQTNEQNAQSAVYLADLDDYMTEVETMISENQSQVVSDANDAKTALGQMLDRLGDLETNATDNASKIATLFAAQNTSLSDFINGYDSKLAELDQNFAAYLADMLSQAAALGSVLDSHISDYSQKFSTLASNYASHAADIESKMALVSVNVGEYVSAVATILDLLEADYQKVSVDLDVFNGRSGTLLSQYVGDYDSILQKLESDHYSHSAITVNFLNNLGQTEVARINEQFNANLSVQMQMLVSKGLSQSTIPVDATARNQRDRDENLQLHYDRLNRERLENQHRLYEQQVGMRSRMLDGTDRMHAVQQEVLRYQASLVSSIYSLRSEARNRVLAGKQAIFAAKDANSRYGIEVSSNMYAKLQEVQQRTIDSVDRIYQLRDVFAKWKLEDVKVRYQQLQQIESQYLEAIQRKLAAKQDVTKTEISERDTLLGQIQNALTALMSGKERYAVLLMQNANTLAEHKHRAIVELMNTSVQRLEGWKLIADQNMKLMMYQLDERNKLLVGVYAFVERRDDVAPEWKDMSQMIAGLGDSGGGWLTPN